MLSLSCPQCNSMRIYKDGFRLLANGDSSQRWLCRDCAYRFSERKQLQENSERRLSKPSASFYGRRICDSSEESKNLAKIEQIPKTVLAGVTKQTADVKGKIVGFTFWSVSYTHLTLPTILLV